MARKKNKISYKNADAHEPGKSPKKLKGTANTQTEWWLLDDEHIPEAVEGVVMTIREHSARIESQRLLSAKLYGNLSLFGLQGMSVTKGSVTQPSMRDRVTFNATASVTDTAVAVMSKNRPKPQFLTDGGNFKAQRKAKKLTQFCEGIFYENCVKKMAPRSFREACVFGDGFIGVSEKYGRVVHERVLSSEMFVDDIEAFYGEPRQMHRARNVDRRQLAACLPEYAADIMAADAMNDNYAGIDTKSIADQVAVIESWHLPSGPEEDDGLHTICLPGKVIHREKWEHDFFPFARMPWQEPLYGYWSKGLVESLQNIQIEMNKLLWLIQRSMHLMGTFKIALEYGSKVNSGHLNNEVGAIIWYNKSQPVYLTPQVVPAEYYAHFERLKKMAYDQAGIQEMSATGAKPAGLDSGKALREYNDIGADRFANIGQQYEEFHMQLARLDIATASDILKRDKHFEVNVPGKRFLETLDLKDFNLEEDDYIMQVYPVSAFSQDPAQRMQDVIELAQAGQIPKEMVRRLVDFPDLQEVNSLQDSYIDRIEKALDGIVDDGSYDPPDPYINPPFARQMAQMYYNRGRMQGLDEERCDMLQEYMSQCETLIAKAQPPVLGPGAPNLPNGVPQAVPEQPPTSPMLPNAPGAQA